MRVSIDQTLRLTQVHQMFFQMDTRASIEEDIGNIKEEKFTVTATIDHFDATIFELQSPMVHTDAGVKMLLAATLQEDELRLPVTLWEKPFLVLSKQTDSYMARLWKIRSP